MIKLNNIMADEITAGEKNVSRILTTEHVASVEDLLSVMDKYPDVDWQYITNKIRRMLVVMNRRKTDNLTPEVYDIIKYPDKDLEFVYCMIFNLKLVVEPINFAI